MPYPAHMVLILFVQVLKKVLKSLKFELKNPAATLFRRGHGQNNQQNNILLNLLCPLMVTNLADEWKSYVT